MSVCSTKGLIGVDILDDGNVDGGESARAVGLLGGHVCERVNVNVVVLIGLFEGQA